MPGEGRAECAVSHGFGLDQVFPEVGRTDRDLDKSVLLTYKKKDGASDTLDY